MSAKQQHRQRILLALILIAFGFVSARPERLPVRMFTSADGLGSGFVDMIYRDSRGFMWFCTRDGLSRFDGSKFVNYQIGEAGTSPGIETIYETRNGDYWISTTGGTYRFNPTENLVEGKTATSVNAEFVTGARGGFLEDSRGDLWLTSGSLMRLSDHEGKREFVVVDWGIPQKPDTTFNTFRILETSDGCLWLFTSWGIARRLPDGRMVVYTFDQPVYGGNGSVAMQDDRSGRIWIAFLDEIFVVKPEPVETLNQAEPIRIVPLKPTSTVELKAGDDVPMPKIGGETILLKMATKETSSVRRLFQTSDGVMWITAGDHLFQVSNNRLVASTSEQGLPETMSRMEEDAAGNLWIGGNSVLSRLDRHGMVTFDKLDGAASSRFSAISEGPERALYFANADDRISRLTGNRLETVRPNLPEGISHIWTSRFVFVDSTGDFWFLSTGNLYRFSGIREFSDLEGRKPTRTYNSKDGLKSDGMFQIWEDSAGDIWVSTRGFNNLGHGVARLKKGADRFVSFTETEGLPPRRSPSAFAEDKFGNIWMTFYEGGLARFDGERFEFFRPGEKIPEALLSDLLVDQKGRLWVGSTVSGVIRIDDPSAKEPVFNVMTTRQGLSSNNIRTITEDNFGKIYLGTASGVDCLSPDTLQIKHYSVNDGLAADFVVDSHRDRDGNVWFATYSGVSKLVPQPNDERTASAAFVGSLRIAGVEQPISSLGSQIIERGDLSHIENNLQIDFFGVDFRAGEILRYQYKLEGADADWSEPSEQRSVTFANLSPGSYRFIVRVVNSDGVASENPAVVSFRILPPIWARWWFVTLILIAVALVLIGIYRYRLARLRELNSALGEARNAELKLLRSREERLAELEQVRSRIATDLHDDIGASLTQIAILSEVAQAQSKNGDSEPLRLITSVSNELVGTMSDIVWSINPTKDHFSDLTQRMRRFASDLLTARNIVLQFHASHSDDSLIVNSNIRREVFLIFKEAINNIVRHSGARRVDVTVGVEGDELRVTINDDGCGSSRNGEQVAAVDEGGNGIPSMRKRAREMNGKFELAFSAEGTRIDFTIPIEPATRTGGESVSAEV